MSILSLNSPVSNKSKHSMYVEANTFTFDFDKSKPFKTPEHLNVPTNSLVCFGIVPQVLIFLQFSYVLTNATISPFISNPLLIWAFSKAPLQDTNCSEKSTSSIAVLSLKALSKFKQLGHVFFILRRGTFGKGSISPRFNNRLLKSISVILW